MRSRVRGTERNADDRRGLVPAGWRGTFPAHALTAADAVASGLDGQLVECGALVYSHWPSSHPAALDAVRSGHARSDCRGWFRARPSARWLAPVLRACFSSKDPRCAEQGQCGVHLHSRPVVQLFELDIYQDYAHSMRRI